MRNTLIMLSLLLILASSCSRSERTAKYRAERKVVLKIALKDVVEFSTTNGNLLQYYESDTTLVTVIGSMYTVQDSVFVTRYSQFRRTKR